MIKSVHLRKKDLNEIMNIPVQIGVGSHTIDPELKYEKYCVAKL